MGLFVIVKVVAVVIVIVIVTKIEHRTKRDKVCFEHAQSPVATGLLVEIEEVID